MPGERERLLVLCLSANAFGSDWARLEAGTFRFRDPLSGKKVKQIVFEGERFDALSVRRWRGPGAGPSFGLTATTTLLEVSLR